MEARVMTPFQVRVLDILFDSGLGERNYYFTGGTALAEFYLQHRYSDDLDVFTRVSRIIKGDYLEIKRLLEQAGLEVFSEIEDDEFVRFYVRAPNQVNERLKVEFGRYAGAQMSPPRHFGTVVVDSFEDIAVNKVCAIYGRSPSESKDFVDLFFILRESKFTLDYLVGRAREKEAPFDHEEAILEFATNLRGVKELHRLPRMIKPLTLEELQADLIPKAEAIIRRLAPARS